MGHRFLSCGFEVERSGGLVLVAGMAVVNLYREARWGVEVTSQVIYGWGVEVLEERDGWALVRTHDGYTGWGRRDAFCEAERGGLRVEGVSANVYFEPDVKVRAAMVQVPWEARLVEVAREGGWVRVRLVDGREGFVHAGDVAANAAPLVDVGGMIAVGMRFLGVTYTWGGVSSVGYDCSGFVQMMLRQREIGIPRDAQAQMRWEGFRPVALETVEAGDVVFFGAADDEITHVGMCVGGGEFLHSTTEGRPGVQVSRLGDAPWPERVRCARRLCG